MAKRYSVVYFCIVLFGTIDVNTGQRDASMRRLFADLLEGGHYSKIVAPMGEGGRPLTVTFNLDIKRLISLDTEKQVLSLDASISMMWLDNQFRWFPEDYANINMIRVPSKLLWQPDIILYNSAYQFNGLPSGDINMVIMFNGFVVYSPLVKTNSFCTIRNKRPNRGDIVTCSLKFGSWAYDGLAIDIMPAGATEEDSSDVEYDVDLTSLEAGFNREWEVISASVKRNVIVYQFAPEPYIDITYELMIKYKGDA